MSHFGNIGHHLQIFVGNYIPNTWVMFNWDMTNDPCYWILTGLLRLTMIFEKNFWPSVPGVLEGSWRARLFVAGVKVVVAC